MIRIILKSAISMMALVAALSFSFIVSALPEALELNINNQYPAVAASSQALIYWAETIEEICGGRVKITIHHGSTLLKSNEVFRGIQSGVASGGCYVLNRQDGFSLNSFITLPFMGFPSQSETASMYKEMIRQYPELAAEYQGLTIIGLTMTGPTGIHTIDKPVEVPGDLEGLRIQGAEATTAEAVGASSVLLDTTDVFTSVDTKLVDGFINHVPALMAFNILDKLHSHTFFGPGGINMIPMMLVMNTEILNSLPKDIREKISASGRLWEDKIYALDSAMQEEGYRLCEERGDTINHLTPDQVTVWFDLVNGSIHEKWIKENEEKGLPARKIFDQARSHSIMGDK